LNPKNDIYKKRRALIWEMCKALDLEINPSAVGLFAGLKLFQSNSRRAGG